MSQRLKIERVEAILVDIPTIRTHHLAFANVNVQNHVIVRIHADGLTGTGEASTVGGPAWGDESVEGIKTVIDRYLVQALVGEDANELARLNARMEMFVKGNPFAKAAVETALHDLVARARGLPMHALLGGKVRDAIPVAWTLAAGETGRDIEEAQEMLRLKRHNMFKLKVGARDPQQDYDHVAAICKAVGDRASIRLDVNQAWDPLTAARWLPRLGDAGVDLVEQPIPRWNLPALRRLRGGKIAVMADESLGTPQDAFALAREAAVDVFSLKLTKHGGIAGTLKVAAVGEAAGIALYGGAMLETGIGTATQVHTYGVLGNLTAGCECFGPLILKDTITREKMVFEDFTVKVPDGPGHGMTLDEDKLARYRRPA